jgi:hypothetical protein
MVFVSLGLPDLDGMVRIQGIAFPDHSDALDAEKPIHKRSSSPIRSGGGVRTVWYGSDANLGSA